jgi:hypothetical protein
MRQCSLSQRHFSSWRRFFSLVHGSPCSKEWRRRLRRNGESWSLH